MITFALILLVLLLCCIWCLICYICNGERRRRREKQKEEAAVLPSGDSILEEESGDARESKGIGAPGGRRRPGTRSRACLRSSRLNLQTVALKLNQHTRTTP